MEKKHVFGAFHVPCYVHNELVTGIRLNAEFFFVYFIKYYLILTNISRRTFIYYISFSTICRQHSSVLLLFTIVILYLHDRNTMDLSYPSYVKTFFNPILYIYIYIFWLRQI